jgi:hypothetical protein
MWVKMKFGNQMCRECIKIRLMVHKGNEECSHICCLSVIDFAVAWFVLMVIAAKKNILH